MNPLRRTPRSDPSARRARSRSARRGVATAAAPALLALVLAATSPVGAHAETTSGWTAPLDLHVHGLYNLTLGFPSAGTTTVAYVVDSGSATANEIGLRPDGTFTAPSAFLKLPRLGFLWGVGFDSSGERISDYDQSHRVAATNNEYSSVFARIDQPGGSNGAPDDLRGAQGRPFSAIAVDPSGYAIVSLLALVGTPTRR